jgi:predicted ester cyclase
METLQEKNKKVVLRFNKEILEEGNFETFKQIMHDDFINRSAPEHANKKEDVFNNITKVLHKAFPDMRVEIYDQIAEDDRVTTRKAIFATHAGELMGIPPTNKKVKIDVIDIVTVRDGKYFEHWGINTLHNVAAELKSAVATASEESK